MRSKFILSVLFTLLFSVLTGVVFSMVTGIHPLAIAGPLFITYRIVSYYMPAGVAGMGILRELWTGEIVKKFRHDGMWLSRVPSRNDLVVNNTIHLVDIGADPEVLINNTTYPIPSAIREDVDIPIGLDKFDTENTIITDDELQGLPYDKPGSVTNQHNEVLEEKTAEKAAHSLSPSSHSATTPIIATTGSSNGETVARKMMTPNDIISLKKAWDKKKYPKNGRCLVLSPEHVADLLTTDEKFARQYKDMKSGTILPMYGFDIYEFTGNPKYSYANSAYTKKAFGAADDDANDHVASFAFIDSRVMQFRGDIKMYNSQAAADPEMRRSLVGFRLYHMCINLKTEGIGAIVSASA